MAVRLVTFPSLPQATGGGEWEVAGLDWFGLDWIGLVWIGLVWIGLEKGYFEDLVMIVCFILEVYTQAGVSSAGGWRDGYVQSLIFNLQMAISPRGRPLSSLRSRRVSNRH